MRFPGDPCLTSLSCLRSIFLTPQSGSSRFQNNSKSCSFIIIWPFVHV